MLFCMYILKNNVERINLMKKKIKDEETNLSAEKGKLNSIIYDIKLAINELYYITKNESNLYLSDKLSYILKLSVNVENGKDFKMLLQDINSNFENYDFENYSSSNYSSYYFFDKSVLRCLVNSINNKQREFNVFENQCLTGMNLEEIKSINKNAITYGLERNNYNAEQAKKVADRIIKGELKGSRISNDVFDLTLCTAICNDNLSDNMGFSGLYKPEKNLIHQMLRYTRNDGIFFIAIPYYRMYKDICNVLSKNLKNVNIIKGIDQDKLAGLIYIFGQKKENKDIDKNTYSMLRKCYDFSKINTIDKAIEMNFKYTLPTSKNEIDIFKGSVLDAEELLNVLQNSNCIDTFFEKQKITKIHENTIEPLLPFNIGQIGLVLTSGCLDGIIDEGDGHCHLVKGKVSKKVDIDRTISGNNVEEVETSSNKVEINVLLPNGDFKVLA